MLKKVHCEIKLNKKSLAYRLSLKVEGCSFYVPESDLLVEKLFKNI